MNKSTKFAKNITLCIVVHKRFGNLANALHSAGQIATDTVVVDASGSSGKTVKHLASEFDARYRAVPSGSDESVLLNGALDDADTPWALFLHQQEVLHIENALGISKRLKGASVLAFNLPVIRFQEPNNHHFETRLVRTDKEIRWEHAIYPSLDSSLEQAGRREQLDRAVAIMPLVAIVSLGEAESDEEELRFALGRIEGELEKDPQDIRYWYYFVTTGWALEEWELVHRAIEDGLNAVSAHAELANKNPFGVNGLIGLFCRVMQDGKYYPDKTVDSLWTIYNNIEGDGRYSVPLGRLLLASKRGEDAVAAQAMAIAGFFRERRYHLSLEEGLYQPAMMAWEITWRQSEEKLLQSVLEVQNILKRHKFNFQMVLQYVFKQNEELFSAIQNTLKKKLRNTP